MSAGIIRDSALTIARTRWAPTGVAAPLDSSCPTTVSTVKVKIALHGHSGLKLLSNAQGKKITALIDVDECLVRPCGQNCANVYGSYRCYCHLGYQLSDADGMTCEGRAGCQGLGLLGFLLRGCQLLVSASCQTLTSVRCLPEVTPVPTAASTSRAVTTAPAPLLVTSWRPIGKRARVCEQSHCFLCLNLGTLSHSPPNLLFIYFFVF